MALRPLALVAVIGVASASRAEIVYRDIPDIAIPLYGEATLDLDADGQAELRIISFESGIGPHLYAESLTGAGVMVDPGLTQPTWSPPLRFWADRAASGAPVGPFEQFEPHARLLMAIDFGPVYGDWLGVGGGHLGVRFARGGLDHYGWIRATRTTPIVNGLITIHDLAWESLPGQSIPAGAVPGTGTLAVVVALLAPCRKPRRATDRSRDH